MRYYLTSPVVDETLAVLRSFGTSKRPHEGVALWGGIETTQAKFVTTVIRPDAETGPGFFRIPHEAAARIGPAMRKAGVVYIAQVHSHPTYCSVDHSDGDDRDAFLKFQGLLSIVVPDYARGQSPLRPFEQCGVHLFEGEGFRRLSDETVQNAFTTLPVNATPPPPARPKKRRSP
jgi:hypothetical protein